MQCRILYIPKYVIKHSYLSSQTHLLIIVQLGTRKGGNFYLPFDNFGVLFYFPHFIQKAFENSSNVSMLTNNFSVHFVFAFFSLFLSWALSTLPGGYCARYKSLLLLLFKIRQNCLSNSTAYAFSL